MALAAVSISIRREKDPYCVGLSGLYEKIAIKPWLREQRQTIRWPLRSKQSWSRRPNGPIQSMSERKTPLKPVKLLSGGNPQIAKADGDAPVRAYIAAMPDWKRAVGERLDKLIVEAVPKVQKAVRWNSPFYGVEGQGWFVTFHVFTRYVKVSFFKGTSLEPIPPGGTPKSGECRWLDIYENDEFDESQFLSWLKQAADIPGWIP